MDIQHRDAVAMPYQQHTLSLPAGNIGLHFSKTVSCEIQSINKESPILNSSINFLGRVVSRLYIPNRVEICGALDNITIESILAT